MQRRNSVQLTAVAIGLVAMAAGVFGQQAPAPAGREGAAPQGQAPAAPTGGLQRDPVAPLLYSETWRQPAYTGDLTDEKRRATQGAVTNAQLELKTYGPSAALIGVRQQEGRFDLWTGQTTSGVAVLLRHKGSFVDLTGISKVRAIVRTNALHVIYPMLRLADGTYIAGSRGVDTEGHFVSTEWAYGGAVGAPMRWYTVDPVKLVTGRTVANPDLSRVDEVGWVDFMPAGGGGQAGWMNISTVEVYARGVPR